MDGYISIHLSKIPGQAENGWLFFTISTIREILLDHFVAIDFETATAARSSACAVGIVRVEAGAIVEEYYRLIRPPHNQYTPFNISIHGISPRDTREAPTFADLYPEIRKMLEGRKIVAHNESFDRGVLRATMEYYGLDYTELGLDEKWECTVKLYRKKGYTHANLAYCCHMNGIELRHHEALSDARACAQLYLLRNEP